MTVLVFMKKQTHSVGLSTFLNITAFTKMSEKKQKGFCFFFLRNGGLQYAVKVERVMGTNSCIPENSHDFMVKENACIS